MLAYRPLLHARGGLRRRDKRTTGGAKKADGSGHGGPRPPASRSLCFMGPAAAARDPVAPVAWPHRTPARGASAMERMKTSDTAIAFDAKANGRSLANPQTATRVGPVYFQPLEQELGPIAHYLSGHLLNAGCGSRAVNSYLLANGVTTITNYDIASQDPEVVVGSLESMPFKDGTFDTVLCNAFLEHVANVEDSIRELARVVKPDGHVVVAVPFLQPFHACPTDFRRYTADGLADLGWRAGLNVVCVLPVHSIAQTLGWIIWEYAREKGGRLRRSAAWAIAFVATRLWNRTDPTVVRK